MKQVECNKCGRCFEVEGEWGYCPFCENDNVEVKKSLEEEIEMLKEHKFYADNIIQAYADKCKNYEKQLAEQPKQIIEKIKHFVHNNYIYVEETDLPVIKRDLLYRFLDNSLKEMMKSDDI